MGVSRSASTTSATFLTTSARLVVDLSKTHQDLVTYISAPAWTSPIRVLPYSGERFRTRDAVDMAQDERKQPRMLPRCTGQAGNRRRPPRKPRPDQLTHVLPKVAVITTGEPLPIPCELDPRRDAEQLFICILTAGHRCRLQREGVRRREERSQRRPRRSVGPACSFRPGVFSQAPPIQFLRAMVPEEMKRVAVAGTELDAEAPT